MVAFRFARLAKIKVGTHSALKSHTNNRADTTTVAGHAAMDRLAVSLCRLGILWLGIFIGSLVLLVRHSKSGCERRKERESTR